MQDVVPYASSALLVLLALISLISRRRTARLVLRQHRVDQTEKGVLVLEIFVGIVSCIVMAVGVIQLWDLIR
jgi:hypothetical protein